MLPLIPASQGQAGTGTALLGSASSPPCLWNRDGCHSLVPQQGQCHHQIQAMEKTGIQGEESQLFPAHRASCHILGLNTEQNSLRFPAALQEASMGAHFHISHVPRAHSHISHIPRAYSHLSLVDGKLRQNLGSPGWLQDGSSTESSDEIPKFVVENEGTYLGRKMEGASCSHQDLGALQASPLKMQGCSNSTLPLHHSNPRT